MLLTGLSYGMAFVIASLPYFIFFPPIGFAFAWMGGVTIVGPPIFVFTILWSGLYTWALGPKRALQERRSIVYAANLCPACRMELAEHDDAYVCSVHKSLMS